jgi:hypothetical protein
MSIPRTLTLFAAGALTLAAQQGTVGGPISGYVYDGRSHAMRAIRGIPGASLVGESIDVGAALNAAWVSPALDSAFVVTDRNEARLYRLENGKAVERRIDGLSVPDRVIFSPSGSAVALFTGASAQIYRGLPDAPALAGTLQLPEESAISGIRSRRPTANSAALSDDGRYLLYRNGGAVELLGVAGDSRRLTQASAAAELAFAAGSHDAAVIDAQGIALFQDAAGAATVRRLPGVAKVHGAAYSTDGKRLILSGDQVSVVDLASGDRTDLACNCRPVSLARMGAAFRLNEIGDGPLWLLDLSAAPAVLFVPASP